jgi:hypothetical protein
MSYDKIVFTIYEGKVDARPGSRKQKWRWRARNSGNKMVVASSNDAYVNFANCAASCLHVAGDRDIIVLESGKAARRMTDEERAQYA